LDTILHQLVLSTPTSSTPIGTNSKFNWPRRSVSGLVGITRLSKGQKLTWLTENLWVRY
jgi:hypothetical protein